MTQSEGMRQCPLGELLAHGGRIEHLSLAFTIERLTARGEVGRGEAIRHFVIDLAKGVVRYRVTRSVA